MTCAWGARYCGMSNLGASIVSAPSWERAQVARDSKRIGKLWEHDNTVKPV